MCQYENDPVLEPPLKRERLEATSDPNHRRSQDEDIEMMNIDPVTQDVDLSSLLSASVGNQQNTVAQVVSARIDVPEQRAPDNQGASEIEVRQHFVLWRVNAH